MNKASPYIALDWYLMFVLLKFAQFFEILVGQVSVASYLRVVQVLVLQGSLQMFYPVVDSFLFLVHVIELLL
jgi:hypothetical protein